MSRGTRDSTLAEAPLSETSPARASRPDSLLAGLESADVATRVAACIAAPSDPSAVVYVDALANALGDADLRVGRAASDALVVLSRSHDVQSPLKRALHGSSREARWSAAFTLSRIAPPEPALLPAAIEAFASPGGDVRWAAARLVVDMGRLHDDVLPAALALAAPGAESGEKPEIAVRRMALFCLRELAPDEPAVADAVLRCLAEAAPAGDCAAQTSELRRAALTCAFGLLGPAQEFAGLGEAVAAHLRSDPDPSCQRLAAFALAEWATRSGNAPEGAARAALEDAQLRSADPTLREAAQRALAPPVPKPRQSREA